MSNIIPKRPSIQQAELVSQLPKLISESPKLISAGYHLSGLDWIPHKKACNVISPISPCLPSLRWYGYGWVVKKLNILRYCLE